MKLKRILACIMAATTLFTGTMSSGFVTSAEENTEQSYTYDDYDYELTYTLSDGMATITGYEGDATEITIPSSIDGYKVVAIGANVFSTSNSAYYNDNDSYCKIRKVTIEEGITTISYNAFNNCRDLSEIVLPDSLTEICSGAFMGCINLHSVIIPRNTNISASCLGIVADFSCYNPDTDGTVVIDVEDFVIYGYNGSSAFNYALSHGFTFIALDDVTTETSTTEETTTTTTETSTTELTTETTAETSTTQTTITNDFLPGDCNNDGLFSISDVVLLQRWLLNVSGTSLNNWEAADLCEDGQINAFDLCVMKQMLLGL